MNTLAYPSVLRMVLSSIFLCGAIYATTQDAKSDDGVTINADESVRCKKDNRTCLAKGNVRLKKGTEEFKAQAIKAQFTDQQALSSADAKGDVSFGNERFYTQTQAAHYSADTNELTATGAHSKVIDLQKNHAIEADKIHITFDENHGNHPTPKDLREATATKNVSVRTPTDHVSADTAFYCAKTGAIRAAGHVVITRKDGCLQAHTATGNLTHKTYTAGSPPPHTPKASGVSSKKAPKEPVYGIFFPTPKPPEQKLRS
ncbi:MAG: hypothetical protein H6849_00325 [Alphaproteobacteria bacterium]|nr:MAG: hypothetical protein H6849_00325 [Alphaproteobacteria bacterium]